MARTSSADALDKFRFQVAFFDLEVGLLLIEPQINDSAFTAGFSEVTPPTANIKERLYRENISPVTYTKAAGLVTYEPVTLRKGKVSGNRAFYVWQDRITNAAANLSPLSTAAANANAVPIYTPAYRKDVVITAINRAGEVEKAWFLFNTFPIKYSGGDSLTASADEKLVEELTITYENFVELNTDQISQLNNAISDAVGIQVAAAALAILLG